MGIGKRKGKFIKCDWCGKESYHRQKQINENKHFFCSTLCANKFQGRNKIKFICKICGKEFWWSKSRLNQDYKPRYCGLECRDKDPIKREQLLYMRIKQQYQNGLNKLELAGQKLLKSIGIDFNEQVLINDKFLVDVYIPSRNLIIQWDGDYWHGHSRFRPLDRRQRKQRQIDKSQASYFTKCGFHLLRLWESDVKKNPEQVKREIINCLVKIKNGTFNVSQTLDQWLLKKGVKSQK